MQNGSHGGLSAWKIHQMTGLNLLTVQNVIEGKDCRESSVMPVLKVLNLKYQDAVVDASRSRAIAAYEERSCGLGTHEWVVDEFLTGWETAANGLQYKIWRMKHRDRDGKLARGKQYDLTIPATKDKERLRTLLDRHPKVCDKFRGHPQIPVHLSSTRAGCEDLWWVIDEWIEGPTLAVAMSEGLIRSARRAVSGDGGPDGPAGATHGLAEPVPLAQIMSEVAMGLKALHAEEIICRELSPASILLRSPTGTVVLTDFELAKLSDGTPTVSRAHWPRNPYRAPEVGAPTIDTRVDVYSWGRILVHALCGDPIPPREKEADALAKIQIPKHLRELAVACTSKVCTQRPRGIDEVISAVRRWK
jgi:serine/threonine protein kinase